MTALALAMVLSQASSGGLGYEDRLVQWGLEQHGREREPAPIGKRIEEVLVSAETVISQSDPWPNLFNLIHVRTRESVIRREVLVTPGDTWSTQLIAETERNLRRLFLIGAARLVPVKGKAGGVALLVVTKDRWSLRLTNSFTLIGPLLQSLRLSLNEINFLGFGQQLSIDTLLRLDTLSIGQTFIERRLGVSKLYLEETANIVFNRVTGLPEGTLGEVRFGRPLIALKQEWAGLVEGAWNVRRRRVFRGGSVWALPYPTDASSDTVPFVYDVREFAVNASGTRSFGSDVKVDVTAALGGYVHQYTPPQELSDDKRAWLVANRLPQSENVGYLYAHARAYPANFKVLRDIDSYELSEDFQLGWFAQASARWALPLPFATVSFVEVGGSVRYRLHAGDDLLTLSAAGAMRLRPNATAANQHVAAEVINYSPKFYGGRLVTRLIVDVRKNDLTGTQQLLGGSTGLRGAAAELLSGKNLVLANVEYRMRPFEVLTTWLGLVWFYDVGSAFDERAQLVHTTGVGLRILIPQLNNQVIRVDFGMVIGGPAPGPDRLNATWGQVTDLRPTEASSFLDQPL